MAAQRGMGNSVVPFAKQKVVLTLVMEWDDDFTIHADICHIVFSSPCLLSPSLSMLRREGSTDFLDGSLVPKIHMSLERPPPLSLTLELMPCGVLVCDKRPECEHKTHR